MVYPSARRARAPLQDQPIMERTRRPFSCREHFAPTAKRFNPIAQGNRSAALGWWLGKNCEP